MNKVIYLLTILILTSCSTSSTDEATEIKQDVVIDMMAEENAVKKVMKTYKETLESLDVTESYALFTEDSEVLEQGKIEGTYRD